MELKICRLYPDILNLYSDIGNVTCLCRRLEWRGIGVSVSDIFVGDTSPLSEYDIFFIGGGNTCIDNVLLRDLECGRAAEIRAAVDDENIFLAISEGFQLLGRHFKTSDGQEISLIGALDVYTVEGSERHVGDYLFECTHENGSFNVVGFENHSAETYLGSVVPPLGTIITGFGNNGSDKTEGARYKNVFASYAHGPLLPKNPGFADFILETALRRKYGEAALAPLDDSLENSALTLMLERLRAR